MSKKANSFIAHDIANVFGLEIILGTITYDGGTEEEVHITYLVSDHKRYSNPVSQALHDRYGGQWSFVRHDTLEATY